MAMGNGPTMAGTFRAEQRSETCFDLVSVTTPSAPNESQAEPRKRKKKTPGENFTGFTILPALRSIEPLLLSTSEGFFSPSNALRKVQKEQKSKNALPAVTAKNGKGLNKPLTAWTSAGDRETREADIDRAVQRLHRGNAEFIGGEAEDLDEVKWLTRPKGSTRQPKTAFSASSSAFVTKSADDNVSEDNSSDQGTPRAFSSSSPLLSATSRSESSRQRKKGHATHYDLFNSGIPGADARTVSYPSNHTPRVWRRSSTNLASGLSRIKIVPESAADAFFEAEKRALDRAAKEKKSLRGRIKNALQAHAAQAGNAPPEGKGDSRLLGSEETADSMTQEEKSNPWADLLDAVVPSKKIEAKRRESCEALRMFCFGAVGNENERRAKDKEKIYYEHCGSPEEVVKLWKIFCGIDTDGSGRVDVPEFRQYAEKVGNKKLGEKAMVALLGKRSAFTLEDLMRVVWPCAQPDDLKKMRNYIKDHVRSMQRVPEPPVLDPAELEGLVQTFRYFDKDGSGTVSLEELVTCGILDNEAAKNYLRDWDDDGNGELDEEEFARMLCPCGFRAYPDATVATDKDGAQILYEEHFGWRLRSNLTD